MSFISGSAPDFLHLCFEWGPTQWRQQVSVLAVTTATPEFSPGTDSSGSCSPVGWVTEVSHTIPSYPVGMVQPKSKPASSHPQCHHKSQGWAPSQGWHLTSLLLTVIISNKHFCTTPPRFTLPVLRIESSPRGVTEAYWKNYDHPCPW